MPFEIKKTYRFEAGHSLEHHNGKCRIPHGHSYKIQVCLKGETLQCEGPQKNMLIDFAALDTVVKPMIEDHFDHKWLNDSLETDSPTAECIAQWIFEFLLPHFSPLESVTVWETESSYVCYSRERA